VKEPTGPPEEATGQKEKLWRIIWLRFTGPNNYDPSRRGQSHATRVAFYSNEQSTHSWRLRYLDLAEKPKASRQTSGQ